MNIQAKDYREILKNAEAFKLTGQTRIYLDDDCIHPWDKVSAITPGCARRLDISTEIDCTAVIDGLQFRWSVAIESREANGKGYYQVDTEACLALLYRVPAEVRPQLRQYFAECAEKVQAKYREWKAITDRQARDADALFQLSRS